MSENRLAALGALFLGVLVLLVLGVAAWIHPSGNSAPVIHPKPVYANPGAVVLGALCEGNAMRQATDGRWLVCSKADLRWSLHYGTGRR